MSDILKNPFLDYNDEAESSSNTLLFSAEHAFADNENGRMMDTDPVFRRKRTSLWSHSGTIYGFAVSNGVAVVGSDTGKILIYSLLKAELPELIDELNLPIRPRASLGIFLDPTGRHMIIRINTDHWGWYTVQSSNFIFLTKFGRDVCYLCWNTLQTDRPIGKRILIGTSAGEIYEMEVPPPEKGLQLVLRLDDVVAYSNEESSPNIVCGISMHLNTNYTNPLLVFIATPERLFRFVGGFSNQPPYFGATITGGSNFSLTETVNTSNIGHLSVFTDLNNAPTHFVWAAGLYVVTGMIFRDLVTGTTSISKTKNLKFTKFSSDPPLAVVATQYHCILLYQTRFMAINLGNDEIVCNDVLENMNGIPKGLAWDHGRRELWYYTSMAVFMCEIVRENRKMWKICMHDHDYEQAMVFAECDADKRSTILFHKAEYCVELGQYMEAAHLYSQCKAPFEWVIFQLMQANSKDSLLYYTRHKLGCLREENMIQKNLLSLLIIEILLSEMASLPQESPTYYRDCEALKRQLRMQLVSPETKSCITRLPSVYYNMLEQYENTEMLLYLAETLKDYEKIIFLKIQNLQYTEALKVLEAQEDPELVYKVSHELFLYLPKETVDCWIKMSVVLDHKRVLFCAMYYDVQRNSILLDQLVRYLKHCIDISKTRHPIIHNYLISLYCISNNHSAVIKYLKETTPEDSFYDKQYVLRLCFQHKIYPGCVRILFYLEQYEEAVSLALTFDLKLAKECANGPTDVAHKRKLWLKIAQSVFHTHMDVDSATEFLKESNFLKFEDMLPFFSEFKKIDNFKSAICDSIRSYNTVVNSQKSHIERLASISDKLRKENAEADRRSLSISGESECFLCSTTLLTKPFYAFPCHHICHQTCYIRELFHLSLPDEKQRLLKSLSFATEGSRIVKASQPMAAAMSDFESGSSHTPSSSKYFDHALEVFESLSYNLPQVNKALLARKNELDERMTKECIFCGSFAIRTISLPLIIAGTGFFD